MRGAGVGGTCPGEPVVGGGDGALRRGEKRAQSVVHGEYGCFVGGFSPGEFGDGPVAFGFGPVFIEVLEFVKIARLFLGDLSGRGRYLTDMIDAEGFLDGEKVGLVTGDALRTDVDFAGEEQSMPIGL